MEYFQRPKVAVLKGEDAVQALNEYINELTEYEGNDFTGSQKEAMIKLATGLISTIEGQTPENQETAKASFLANITRALRKNVSQIFPNEENPIPLT